MGAIGLRVGTWNVGSVSGKGGEDWGGWHQRTIKRKVQNIILDRAR